MRKINKILDIEDGQINYINGTCVAMEICCIRHTPVHLHNNALELIYCVEGSLTIRCNHEIITIHEGEIFTVNFEDIHCLYSEQDNLVIVMHLDMSAVNKQVTYLHGGYFACEDHMCRDYQKKPLRKVKSIVLASAYTYAKNDSLEKEEADYALHQIIDILSEYFDWFNYLNSSHTGNTEIRDRFEAVAYYCRNNYTKKVTISELAKSVHLNESYLSQFIRKSPYGSFSNMIGYVRCFKAQVLLLTTELSVIEISSLCGFSDDKYFYKHFKQVWNMTPKEYKSWFREYIKYPDEKKILSKDKTFEIIESYAASYFAENILNIK